MTTRLPTFAQPGAFLRFQGPTEKFPTFETEDPELRFIRLKRREGPLKYPYTFQDVGPGDETNEQSFQDLELTEKHIAQIYFGISKGGRARFWHPFNTRLLKWDQATLDLIEESDTGTIEHADSPIEAPEFEFWLAPTENVVPAFSVENILNLDTPQRTIDIEVLFLAQIYTFDIIEHVEEPRTRLQRQKSTLYDKLLSQAIPSRFVSFGGEV